MIARLAFLLLTFTLAQAQKDALSCKDHPLYRTWFNPPLIKSWDQHESPAEFDKVFYNINFKKYTYRPRGQPTSNKYKHLDIFHNTGLFATKGRLSTLYFQRPVKIYMLIGMPKRETRSARVPGWKSEGYAELEGQEDLVEWNYGVFQKDVVKFTPSVYVFSKMVPRKQITLPTKSVVMKAMRPVKTQIFYHFLIAEANGKPYAGSKGYFGRKIAPNRPCPAALHRAWRVRHTDNRDPDIRGKKWPSWHPQWDPCFWCTYGHDHGSSAKHIMGYEPTFTYAAWKNGREKEADEGFKAYVIKYGQYWLYINIHVQASQLRRVTARYHTIAIAIIKISTGEKMVELTHKADFGFLAVRGKVEKFISATKKDEAMRAEMMKDKRPMFRSVNVINPEKPDPRFEYRDRMFQGVYEAWQTIPMCSVVNPHGGIQVDIRTPSSGIKTVTKKEFVALRVSDNRRNVGLSRVIRIRSLEIAPEHCAFKTKGGYFYTNPDGKVAYPRPGPGRIRQYIKRGFRLKIDGRYEPLNAGLGLYGRVDFLSLFWDHSFGMNPDKN